MANRTTRGAFVATLATLAMVSSASRAMEPQAPAPNPALPREAPSEAKPAPADHPVPDLQEKKTDAMSEIDTFISKQNVDKSKSGWRTKLAKPPQVSFDTAKKYVWVLDTNKGQLRLTLMPEVAPMHVSSTIYLTRLGFYDGLAFHRVIPGFMAQGGDPLGNGTGGPGYQYAGEFSQQARHDGIGVLSMANAGPNTDGSQFFITFAATPHLDGRHTVFGRVSAGTNVLGQLEKCGTASGRTTEKLEITKAAIVVE